MRWTQPERDPWQPWFAWHPVKIGREWVWLETVERCFMGGGFGDYAVYYRHPGERPC